MSTIIEGLESKGVNVHHKVDATKLDTYDFLNQKRFDRLIFNFPCIPGENTGKDAQLNEIAQNKEMLDQVF